MRRHRLTMLGAVLGIALVWASLGAAAYTMDDLFGYCFSEVVPELGLCYSRVLVGYFFENYTKDELNDLARHGPTPCVRFTAIEALKLYRIFIPPVESDVCHDCGDCDLEELRAAGVAELNEARMYYFCIRGEITIEQLEADAANTEIGQLAVAAGELLGGYYSPGSFNPITEQEAIDLMENGATPGLRLAGGIALVTYIAIGESDYGAELSEQELRDGIIAATGWDLGRLHVYQYLLATMLLERAAEEGS